MFFFEVKVLLAEFSQRLSMFLTFGPPEPYVLIYFVLCNLSFFSTRKSFYRYSMHLSCTFRYIG